MCDFCIFSQGRQGKAARGTKGQVMMVMMNCAWQMVMQGVGQSAPEAINYESTAATEESKKFRQPRLPNSLAKASTKHLFHNWGMS